ncbi:hypothetical protein COO60DRAFT_606728 [Scenedesmus sp. NREL 46B-D3]|nr:hypothetical protein COO60DRAFT_606728 [Scenedesmus sp. NREL 46B-D3]
MTACQPGCRCWRRCRRGPSCWLAAATSAARGHQGPPAQTAGSAGTPGGPRQPQRLLRRWHLPLRCRACCCAGRQRPRRRCRPRLGSASRSLPPRRVTSRAWLQATDPLALRRQRRQLQMQPMRQRKLHHLQLLPAAAVGCAPLPPVRGGRGACTLPLCGGLLLVADSAGPLLLLPLLQLMLSQANEVCTQSTNRRSWHLGRLCSCTCIASIASYSSNRSSGCCGRCCCSPGAACSSCLRLVEAARNQAGQGFHA